MRIDYRNCPAVGDNECRRRRRLFKAHAARLGDRERPLIDVAGGDRSGRSRHRPDRVQIALTRSSSTRSVALKPFRGAANSGWTTRRAAARARRLTPSRPTHRKACGGKQGPGGGFLLHLHFGAQTVDQKLDNALELAFELRQCQFGPELRITEFLAAWIISAVKSLFSERTRRGALPPPSARSGSCVPRRASSWRFRRSREITNAIS